MPAERWYPRGLRPLHSSALERRRRLALWLPRRGRRGRDLVAEGRRRLEAAGAAGTRPAHRSVLEPPPSSCRGRVVCCRCPLRVWSEAVAPPRAAATLPLMTKACQACRVLPRRPARPPLTTHGGSDTCLSASRSSTAGSTTGSTTSDTCPSEQHVVNLREGDEHHDKRHACEQSNGGVTTVSIPTGNSTATRMPRVGRAVRRAARLRSARRIRAPQRRATC